MRVKNNIEEIRKVTREELEVNNKYFEFAQSQIEKDRGYFKHLFTFTASCIVVVAVVVSCMTYQSVAELKKEVRERIDAEFKDKIIRDLISKAAQDRTNTELTDIIRDEAAKQVAQGIKEENLKIRNAIEDQTKEAVKTLEPTIKTSVDEAMQHQVEISVIPIQSQMKSYGDLIRIGNLTILARADDRQAFDYLLKVAIGSEPESKNPDLNKLAAATVTVIISEKESEFQIVQGFNEKQSLDTLKKLLSSPNPKEREAALNTLPEDKNILPIIVEMIKTDNSIQVICVAVRKFNTLTKQSFKFWKTEEINEWWEKNKASFQ